jgi:tetratricopeptide (TPR) repeat protein
MGSASGEYEPIIRQDPGNILASASLADIYIMEKRHQDALEVYKRLVQADEFSPYLYFNIGLLYFKLGDSCSARESFRKAIDLRSDYTAPIAALAVMAELEKDYVRAADYFKQAIIAQPDDCRIQANLAMVFVLAGSFEDAIQEYEKMLLDYPDYAPARAGIAEVYIQTKKYDEALKYLEPLAVDR